MRWVLSLNLLLASLVVAHLYNKTNGAPKCKYHLLSSFLQLSVDILGMNLSRLSYNLDFESSLSPFKTRFKRYLLYVHLKP